MNSIIQLQNDALKVLADKIPDFYLTGGTALSKYYFQHRQSNDLDFFTHNFTRKRVEQVAEIIGESLSLPIELIRDQTSDKFVKIMMYLVHGKDKIDLKIDFVEDYLQALSPMRITDGINVHAIEDIYVRKIYTVAGQMPQIDLIGRLEASGRNAPKDYYDLYMLSSVFRPLSDFASDSALTYASASNFSASLIVLIEAIAVAIKDCSLNIFSFIFFPYFKLFNYEYLLLY